VEVAWKQADRTRDERYVLSLGIRPAGQPEAAPPRKEAKQFAELALDGPPANFDFAALGRKLPLAVTPTVTRLAVTLDKDGQTYGLAAGQAGGAVGQAVLVELRLTNKGQADVTLTAVLSNTVISSISGQVWPEDGKGNTWYAGYHRAAGQAKQPPRREEAALLLGGGKSRTLVAPNAGFNFGLVAMAQELTVKAGQSVALPLLVISIDRPNDGPDINLATALDAVRPQLLKTATRPE
jgi:hypothetical protein